LYRELKTVYASKDYKKLQETHKCEIKIAKASLLGYGLYDHKDCMIGLGEYIERYGS
jgi:hypothetical protein